LLSARHAGRVIPSIENADLAGPAIQPKGDAHSRGDNFIAAGNDDSRRKNGNGENEGGYEDEAACTHLGRGYLA
jgi:hypothetical protein